MYLTVIKRDTPYPLRFSDLRRAGIPKRYWNAQLSRIPAAAPHFKDVHGWAHHAREMVNAGTGLYVHGKSGQGKTGIAAICAKAVLLAWGSAWFSRADDVAGDVLEDSQHPGDDMGSLSDYWQNANLWVVDDLGTALGREQTQAILEREIRKRLAEGRALVITSNVELDKITSLGEQTMRAIREGCLGVKVSGTDFARIAEDSLERGFRRITGE